MKPTDRHKVSILYKAVEEKQIIYISTEDEMIKEVISEKFEMTPCSSPYEMYKGNESDWMIRGNASLIQIGS